MSCKYMKSLESVLLLLLFRDEVMQRKGIRTMSSCSICSWVSGINELLVVSLTFLFCLHCFVLFWFRLLVSHGFFFFFFNSIYVSLTLEVSNAMDRRNGVRVSPLLYSYETQCIYVLYIQESLF
jgi:hypothetical protein